MCLLSGPEYKIFKILVILTCGGEREFLLTHEDLMEMIYVSRNTTSKSLERLAQIKMITMDLLGKYGTVYRVLPESEWSIKPKAEIPLSDIPAIGVDTKNSVKL
jgi:predicted transcriptional regulator